MKKDLDRVVRRLLEDRRFTARFRRDADAALTTFDLTPDEAEAVKRGNQRELLALGLDPAVLSVRAASRPGWSTALLRHAVRLAAPAALVLALAASFGTAGTASADGPRARARVLTGRRRASARLARRSGHVAPGFARARRSGRARFARGFVRAGARAGRAMGRALVRASEGLDPEPEPIAK